MVAVFLIACMVIGLVAVEAEIAFNTTTNTAYSQKHVYLSVDQNSYIKAILTYSTHNVNVNLKQKHSIMMQTHPRGLM